MRRVGEILRKRVPWNTASWLNNGYVYKNSPILFRSPLTSRLPTRSFLNFTKGQLAPKYAKGGEPDTALRILKLVTPLRYIVFCGATFMVVVIVKLFTSKTHPSTLRILKEIEEYPEIEKILGKPGPYENTSSGFSSYRSIDRQLDVKFELGDVPGCTVEAILQHPVDNTDTWEPIDIQLVLPNKKRLTIVKNSGVISNETDPFKGISHEEEGLLSEETVTKGQNAVQMSKLIIPVFLTVVLAAAAYSRFIGKSEVLELAKHRILSSSHAKHLLGKDMTMSRKYSGTLNSSICQVKIPISGSKLCGIAEVHAVHQDSQWKFSKVDLLIDGLKRRIPISLEETESPSTRPTK